MFIIRVVHDHPNVQDSILGPGWKDKETADAALKKNGWGWDGNCYAKSHPKQGWEMRAFPQEMKDIGSL